MLIGPLENQTQALELLGSWFISIALTPEIFTVKHRAREMTGCFSKSTSELKTFKRALCHWNSTCYAISHLIRKKNQLHFWTLRKGVLLGLVTQRWGSHSGCPQGAHIYWRERQANKYLLYSVISMITQASTTSFHTQLPKHPFTAFSLSPVTPHHEWSFSTFNPW